MPLDHARFKNTWAGIQSIIVSTAVLFGGLWTLYTFISLQLIDKAKTDLEKIKTDLTATQLKLTSHQAVLDITLDASQTSLPYNQGRYISVEAIITNKGSSETYIEWTRATPLAVTHVAVTASGELHRDQLIPSTPLAVGLYGPRQYLIRVGGTLRLPFFVSVKNLGLYYIEFQTEVAKPEKTTARKQGPAQFTTAGDLVWSSSTFIIIR
jgi:hypothetical protein